MVVLGLPGGRLIHAAMNVWAIAIASRRRRHFIPANTMLTLLPRLFNNVLPPKRRRRPIGLAEPRLCAPSAAETRANIEQKHSEMQAHFTQQTVQNPSDG